MAVVVEMSVEFATFVAVVVTVGPVVIVTVVGETDVSVLVTVVVD